MPTAAKTFIAIVLTAGAAILFHAASTWSTTNLAPFAAFLARFKNYLHRVEQAMGALLVLTGIAFLTGGMQSASFWLIDAFPSLGRLG